MMELSSEQQKQNDQNTYLHAVDLMSKGVSNSDVVKELESKGIPRDAGWLIVEKIYADRVAARRREGLKLIAIATVTILAAYFAAVVTSAVCGVGILAFGVLSVSRTQLAEGFSDFFS